MAHPLQIVTPEWVKEQLDRHGLQQKDIAFALNTDKAQVSNWLSGRKEMTNPVRAAIYYFFVSRRGSDGSGPGGEPQPSPSDRTWELM